jgi:hypothetical protein
VFLSKKRTKELCRVPQFLQGNPQAMALLYRKLFKVPTNLESLLVPLFQ